MGFNLIILLSLLEAFLYFNYNGQLANGQSEQFHSCTDINYINVSFTVILIISRCARIA